MDYYEQIRQMRNSFMELPKCCCSVTIDEILLMIYDDGCGKCASLENTGLLFMHTYEGEYAVRCQLDLEKGIKDQKIDVLKAIYESIIEATSKQYETNPNKTESE